MIAETFRWQMQVSEMSEATIRNEIRPVVIRHLKKWTGMGHSCNTNILFISKKNHGLGLPDILTVYKSAKTSLAHILKNSKDEWIKEAYLKQQKLSRVAWSADDELQRFQASQPVQAFRSSFRERKQISKFIRTRQEAILIDEMEALEQQGSMLRSIRKESDGGKIYWLDNLAQLPQQLIKFGLGAITNTLPNATNVAKWYPGRSKQCQRCGKTNQTLGHVLGQCDILLGMQSENPNNRITWRHNKILSRIK